nr:MAG TPA: hypothetical protein [Caudoviricetes sp.]
MTFFSSYYSYAVILRILSFIKNDKISIIYTLCSIEKEIIYFELRLA